MLDKLQADNYGLSKCKYIFEPEAGKGDIIKAYKEYYLNYQNRYKSKWDKQTTDVDKYIKIDAIEYDERLNNLLRGEGHNALPPDITKKHYENMNEGERNWVKEFGFQSEEFDKLVSPNPNYIKLQLN